jgi:cytochrome c
MLNQSLSKLMLVAALGFTAQSALADGAALAEKGTCLMCHNVEKRNVGPAFKDVSAAYKNQADAEDYLVNKIKKGGRGKWGVVPMPANEGKLTDDEFREVVRWIRAM